jgi:glycosyltransferase involved in cell wall biosynthesis/2-polyprenyl-3-methyl-5-hydroxy-6-metoxy-1,4-benzoquinol methylase
MQIALYVSGMPFNGGTIPSGKSLGGSESAGYYMAKELRKLGHEVIVFTESKEIGTWDGVIYEYVGEHTERAPLGDRFHFAMQIPWDVLVLQRHPMGFVPPYNSKLNIWWLHDLAIKRQLPMIQPSLVNIDKILTVSEWHRNQVVKTYGLNPDIVKATWNGVDYEAYRSDSSRIPNQLIFCSRPERGLENLVKPNGIMERLPDYKLLVCGYDNTTDQMREYYEYLWSRCKALPNVEFLGHLGKKDMVDRIAESALYIYPTDFEDTSCMIAMEANAVGTPFLAFQTGALPETMTDGGAKLLKDYKPDALIKEVKKLLPEGKGYSKEWKELNRKALGKRQTWASAASQWEGLFIDLLKEKSEPGYRLDKHLEKQADIDVLFNHNPEKLPEDYIKCLPPATEKAYSFFTENKFQEHYDRYYQYEKDRGVNYGDENLDGNPRFEVVADFIKRDQKNSPDNRKILDYGCAHGHYTFNLAKRFPDVEFFGVDLNQLNIDIANKTKDLYPQAKVDFSRGEASGIVGQYDVIIAGEVLEHVADPVALAAELKKHLTPNGHMVITTPYGPWEWLGREHWRMGWRAHIHHFEKADIKEIFGLQEDFKIKAVPTMGPSEFVGSYVYSFKNCDIPLGQIDYERKLNTQAPQQTLSLCMIVRNAEKTLAKCLEPFDDIADEIIIGIDETTTDRTEQVAQECGAHIIKIKSPLETGFDEARNQTIARASMDWIFWIDDDEKLVRPENLSKYLRANQYDAYGVNQHHYSAEPPELLRTDFPMRLFRNHKGIRFFGVVHEHPEIRFNDGIPFAYKLPDVDIMHTGYSAEMVRRKRFMRNIPLMYRDRQKYPDRKLGKCLWIRDVCHELKFQYEYGRGIAPESIDRAKECIKIWQEIVKDGELRLAIEALPYYSDLCRVLYNGQGFNAVVAVEGNKGDIKVNERNIIQGYFDSSESYKLLQGLLTKDRIEVLEDKYF